MATYFPEFQIIVDNASNFVSHLFFSAWEVNSNDKSVMTSSETPAISEIYY